MLSSDESLKHAIRDYLLWMEAEGYRHARVENDKDTLDQFLRFVQSEKYGWDEIFTLKALKSFQERCGVTHTSVRGLSRYLFDQKRIQTSLREVILPPDFWTLFYFRGESPTSSWSNFPAGVTTLS